VAARYFAGIPKLLVFVSAHLRTQIRLPSATAAASVEVAALVTRSAGGAHLWILQLPVIGFPSTALYVESGQMQQRHPHRRKQSDRITAVPIKLVAAVSVRRFKRDSPTGYRSHTGYPSCKVNPSSAETGEPTVQGH